ncbi:GNAT family N-acetyltransferase [Paenibacillus fonticola]|uniref:GNAT family N-acetyltransferase n=1 Tax=Paenibacillus fonticola TaxID=379896 RepID=UPI00039EE3B6|nr:GNAT family protein [Paenibacillus fonticola]
MDTGLAFGIKKKWQALSDSYIWIGMQENPRLDIEYIGMGLATKATKLLINHSFEELGLRKVEINVARENLKSKAIPERLGFTAEGTIRNYEYLNGEYHDRIIYGLLQDEWK